MSALVLFYPCITFCIFSADEELLIMRGGITNLGSINFENILPMIYQLGSVLSVFLFPADGSEFSASSTVSAFDAVSLVVTCF